MSIKLVAVDMDGTFLDDSMGYDREWFGRLRERMASQGVQFVVASGNQYQQLKSFFDDPDEFCFVAENGGIVVDRGEVVFATQIPTEVWRAGVVAALDRGLDLLVCGVRSAYVLADAPPAFATRMARYYHALTPVASFDEVDDQVVKLALSTAAGGATEHAARLQAVLQAQLIAVTSGHDDIDIIVPGCHKASGLARVAGKRGIGFEECLAFGDGGNDIEMLRACGRSYAMAGSPAAVTEAAKAVAPGNNDKGVLQVLERYFGESPSS